MVLATTSQSAIDKQKTSLEDEKDEEDSSKRKALYGFDGSAFAGRVLLSSELPPLVSRNYNISILEVCLHGMLRNFATHLLESNLLDAMTD